jgi:hypothetical protein
MSSATHPAMSASANPFRFIPPYMCLPNYHNHPWKWPPPVRDTRRSTSRPPRLLTLQDDAVEDPTPQEQLHQRRRERGISPSAYCPVHQEKRGAISRPACFRVAPLQRRALWPADGAMRAGLHGRFRRMVGPASVPLGSSYLHTMASEFFTRSSRWFPAL